MSELLSLKHRIMEDMKTAMKAQDKRRLDAIRLITAAIKQCEIDSRTTAGQNISLDDVQVITILNKMLKQRRDSITQYEAAKRQDLVEQENFEVAVIQTYLPEQLGDADVEKLIMTTIAEMGASSSKDMGKVMAELKHKLQGKADMAAVGAKVKERLA